MYPVKNNAKQASRLVPARACRLLGNSTRPAILATRDVHSLIDWTKIVRMAVEDCHAPRLGSFHAQNHEGWAG